MPITATCSSCGKTFFAPTQFAGKRVKCKGCGEVFTVPGMSGSVESDAGTDPLSQLASIATADLVPPVRSRFGEVVTPSREEEPDESDARQARAPNVLTFNYPFADDIDRWLPIALSVLGFLFLLSGPSAQDTAGVAWISFTRFLTPSLLYVAFTFPITLTMLRKASRELRYAMPPNYQFRCFACYVPPFVLMTWAQFAGEGFTIVQLFAGLMGLAISSALVWLFFRLREEHIVTTVMYGAGGFAAGAMIGLALLLGMNKIGVLVVTSQNAVAKVPVSPFASGFSWPAPPPPAPKPAVNSPPVVSTQPPAPVVNSATPAPTVSETTAIGTFDQGSIPGVLGDVMDPLNDSPYVCILRTKPNGVALEAWNTQTWEHLPGTLTLPNRPSGNIAISTDGQHLAWIAEFPRLSVQIWSFASATVVSSIDLDRSAGPASIVGFVTDNQLLIDVLSEAGAPTAVVQPQPTDTAKPATPVAPVTEPPAKPHNIFDMQQPPKDNGIVWADQTHGSVTKPGQIAPARTDQTVPAGSGSTPSATSDQATGHLMAIVDINTGSTVHSFFLPTLATGSGTAPGGGGNEIRYGQNLAISVASQRLAAACKIDGVPSLIQVSLTTGKRDQIIKVIEIDPGLPGCPTGLAYSSDGENLAALYEDGGSALLLGYESIMGKRISKFVYPSGPLEGAAHWLFRGSAICWLDPSSFWLVYGQGILSTQNGAHIKSADLNLSDAAQQRALQGDRIELLTNTTTGKKLLVLEIDRSKLNAN